MRKIKFRAWDSDRKKMVFEFANEIDSIEYSLITNEDNELFCGNYMDNGDWQEPKLMQFTGLTDKNGKEIYEGDIVKIGLKRTKQVKYNVQGARFWMIKEHFTEEFMADFGDENITLCSNLEVIGNIYENPELL